MPVSTSLPMARRSAIAQARGRSSVRASAISRRPDARSVRPNVPGMGSALEALIENTQTTLGDLVCDRFELESTDAMDVRSRTSAKSIVDYMEKRTATKAVGSNGAGTTPHDAVVLSVLQNYSGLTQDRLFNMLRNSGRFNENQSTLSFILNALTAQGRVLNENGTYRYQPATKGARSPSPAPSGRTASPARYVPAASNGTHAGDGVSASDEAILLSMLQNYSGLTQERLSGMLRNSGKATKGSVSSILSGLVSQGKVQNDNGTYRYVTRAASPAGARTSSPTPARFTSPSRPAARAVGPTAGDGVSASDEAILLTMLSNYAGLTQERLSGMLRNSGKSTKSSVSSILSGLVSQGKVQNDNGTYRYVSRAASPAGARTTSPSPARFTSPSRPAARAVGPTAGDGASASDEAVVMGIMKNYSGLSEERLSNMLRSSGKSLSSSVGTVLSGLVRKNKLSQDRSGIYRM